MKQFQDTNYNTKHTILSMIHIACYPACMKWRENLAKAIYDLGKLTFAALVVGQLVTPQGLQRVVFVLGVTFTILAFVIAVIIDKGGGSHD